MKALFVTEYFPPKSMGGGEISCSLLAKFLAKRGVEVHVLTSAFPGLSRHEESGGVQIHRFLKTGTSTRSLLDNLRRAFQFPRSTRKEIVRICKAYEFDIIHCFNTNSIFGAVKAREDAKLPIVAHINSSVLFCPLGTRICKGKECAGRCTLARFLRCYISSPQIGNMANRFYLRYNPVLMLLLYLRFLKNKRALEKVDYFTPISNYMGGNLLNLGVPKERITVVPNIVEADKFDIMPSKEMSSGKTKILYIGSYVASKGPQILLQALKGMDTGRYECHLYGEGGLKDELKEYAKANLLNVTVHDKIPYDKMPQIYSQHDIIVFPSLVPEAFGRVAIEANLAGKPLIASDIGGIANIVEHKKTGLLVRPGDSRSLRCALLELMEDKTLKDSIVQQGMATAKEKYNGERIASGLIEIYKKVMQTV